MSIVIMGIIVVVVCAMLVWGVDQVDQLQPPFKGLIKCLIIVAGALVILNKAGLLA